MYGRDVDTASRLLHRVFDRLVNKEVDDATVEEDAEHEAGLMFIAAFMLSSIPEKK